MHDPSESQSRPRLGCLWGTFSPSRRQIRSTRLSLTSQPACSSIGSARYRRDDARGLEVSPGSLLQNELVQGQVGDCPAQTAILLLELLQAFHLVGLEPAVLLTPPIIGDLPHADLADRVSDVLALRDHNVDLPQLRDDLFRRVSLLRHCSPPSCQKT